MTFMKGWRGFEMEGSKAYKSEHVGAKERKEIFKGGLRVNDIRNYLTSMSQY